MQSTFDLSLARVRATGARGLERPTIVFVVGLVLCIVASAVMASWLPLQVSIITVFLFAGPHNWFELRYFLSRLPVRFGKSRSFFLTAFAGIGILTATYVALPFIFQATSWSEQGWLSILATWNTLMLLWLAAIVWLRGRQKARSDWRWVFPLVFAISGLNWLAPEFFSLAIVYLHPLVALWFLDRHLARNRREWLPVYRLSLALPPLLLGLMIWRLSLTAPLADDNGLFWRITQHSGAQLLPAVSSHVLVSVHLFLEMLHYGVWLVALPLIGRSVLQPRRCITRGSVWTASAIPVAKHPRGFPKLVTFILLFGLFGVGLLWTGFTLNYSMTRDIYFTVAIAHVLAEAPFLLKMI